MSNLTIRFYSNCLRRYTTFKMYLPCDIRQDWGQTDTKYSENSTKTLFLLHGFTGDAENWVPEYLSDKYNFAVVIPSGENSFWLDGRSTGHQFCKFVGEELVDYVRRVFRLAKDGSETYIMVFQWADLVRFIQHLHIQKPLARLLHYLRLLSYTKLQECQRGRAMPQRIMNITENVSAKRLRC